MENSDEDRGNANNSSALPDSNFSVVIGLCVGVGAAFIIHTISGILLSWAFVKPSVRVEDLYYAMSESLWLNLHSHACSFLAAMFAGVIVSNFERKRPYFYAGLVGALMVIFAAVQFLVPYEHGAPLWSKILAILVPFPATLIGAYVCTHPRRGQV